MGTGSLETSVNYRNFSLATINYLKEHKNELIKEALDYILDSQKAYTIEFDTYSFLETIKEQFDWMIINCNDGTINYDLQLDYMRPAYYDFYLYLLKKDHNTKKYIQETLEDYFQAFVNEYSI